MMAWIRTIEHNEAEGALREEYDKAVRRAGRVYNIVKIMGLRPSHLKASIDLYRSLMHEPSTLTRSQREMLAVVVSLVNRCHYWIEAHAADLRAEVGDSDVVDLFKRDWRTTGLAPPDLALMEFAEKMTRTPWAMAPEDLDRLRGHGFQDLAISDATQIIAYFNYINRIADALGVDLEPDMAQRTPPGSGDP